MLTAEEDRDLVRRHLADQAREKELLGSTTSAYNSDRYVSLGVEKAGFCPATHCLLYYWDLLVLFADFISTDMYDQHTQ